MNAPAVDNCSKCKKEGLIVATSDDAPMCHRCLANYCSQMETVMAKVGEQLCKVCPKVRAFLKQKPPVQLLRVSKPPRPLMMGRVAKC